MSPNTNSDMLIGVWPLNVVSARLKEDLRVCVCRGHRREYHVPWVYLYTMQPGPPNSNSKKLSVAIGVASKHFVDRVRQKRSLLKAQFPLVVITEQCKYSS